MVTFKIVMLVCVSFILGGALMGAACKGFLDNAINKKKKARNKYSHSTVTASLHEANWRCRNRRVVEPMKADIPFTSPKESL